MSEVLARIRVRETHGIRRFLYPLSASVKFPSFVDPNAYGLLSSDSLAVPMQLTPEGEDYYRVDFAVSLPPLTDLDVFLTPHQAPIRVDDPLHITEDGGYLSIQKHFTIELSGEVIYKVVYNSIPHLRGLSHIQRNGKMAWHLSTVAMNYADSCSLYADIRDNSRYDDGAFVQTRAELTACKSWVAITHQVEDTKPNDEIVFTLPLAITSPTLTCDFGVGGYVFGKLDDKATEIVWRTEFDDAPYAKWTVTTAGRVDYVGEVETAEAFLPQRWFHLIDSDKALAVAITRLPDTCQEMTVRLTLEGDVSIAFKLGEAVTGPAEFGVCYHFLNDVPAIAAATNPQSILLPPVVEVLPV